MTLREEDDGFLRGAIAASCDLAVDWVATGYYESVGYCWFRIMNEDSECVLVMQDPCSDSIAWQESFEWVDKQDMTRRFLRSLDWGGSEEEYALWAIILSEDESVNPQLLDKELLRERLDQAHAEFGSNFDFDAWSRKQGFE